MSELQRRMSSREFAECMAFDRLRALEQRTAPAHRRGLPSQVELEAKLRRFLSPAPSV